MLSLTLKHMHFAIAAAEYRSFRRAAEVLRVKPSAVSRTIRQVEDRVGTPIFQRSSGGVRPTPAGRAFLDGARKTLSDATFQFARVKDHAHGICGEIAIGLHNIAIGGPHLRPVLEAMREANPKVTLRIIEDSPEHLWAWLQNDLMDIVVCHDRESADLVGIKLWSEGLAAALPAGHALATRTQLRCFDLKHLPILIGHKPLTAPIETFLGQLAAPSGFANTITHSTDELGLLTLVRIGCGVCLMPQSHTHPMDGVIFKPLADAPMFHYRASWSRRTTNPALRKLLAILRSRFA